MAIQTGGTGFKSGGAILKIRGAVPEIGVAGFDFGGTAGKTGAAAFGNGGVIAQTGATVKELRVLAAGLRGGAATEVFAGHLLK